MTDLSVEQVPADEVANEFNLRHLVRLVLKHYRLIGSIVSGTLLIALAYCFLTPKIWQTVVSIRLPSKSSGSLVQQLSVLVDNSDPVQTYQEIAHSGNVAMRAAIAVDITSTAEYQGMTLDEAADAVRDHLEVTMVKDSTIIEMQVRSKDRDLSVRLGNALAQAFIDANLDFSRTSARSRRQFIEGEIEQVRGQLNMSEEQLERFAAQNKSLVAPSNGTQADQLSAAMNPLMKLKSEIFDLEMQRAEMANRYSKEHPHLLDLDAQIKAAKQKYDQEISRLPLDAMGYNRHDRDVRVGEEIYSVLLGKLEEARINENEDDTDIVIVDEARPPLYPVWPKKFAIMAAALMLSLMIAYGTATSLDYFRDEVKGEEELAEHTQLPMLAVIPDWRLDKEFKDAADSNGVRTRHDPSYLINQPRFRYSYYAEANKILRTNLAFAGLGNGRKIVSLMSANREEGKTLCNANLSIALAQTGGRVLLCDADLRKPAVHKVFGLRARPDQGLPHLVAGTGTPESMIVEGPTPNLWLLPCGVHVPNPSELLGSGRVKVVLDALRERFDYVVFDAAPILPVTDSLLLGPLLDGVGLVVRYEKSRLREVDSALRNLRNSRTNLFGVVLNAVDMYRYAYAYGYGKNYYSYYGNKKKAESE